MIAPFLRATAFATLALVGAAAHAAGVLALANVPGRDQLVLRSAESNATVVAPIATCCAVQAGSVAADTAHHRIYFVGTDGVTKLFRYRYDAPVGADTFDVDAGHRITHLEFDRSAGRLVGLARNALDETLEMVAIDVSTGALSVIGSAPPGCCLVRAGVSAYVASTHDLYVVGRRGSDANESLLRFNALTGTLSSTGELKGEQVAELIADGNALIGLSRSESDAVTRPIRFRFLPTFHIDAIGTGTGDCCYVLAGSIAIDHAHGALLAVARSFSDASFSVWRFDLASGAAIATRGEPALALFEDASAVADRIFADGFE